MHPKLSERWTTRNHHQPSSTRTALIGANTRVSPRERVGGDSVFQRIRYSMIDILVPNDNQIRTQTQVYTSAWMISPTRHLSNQNLDLMIITKNIKKPNQLFFLSSSNQTAVRNESSPLSLNSTQTIFSPHVCFLSKRRIENDCVFRFDSLLVDARNRWRFLKWAVIEWDGWD